MKNLIAISILIILCSRILGQPTETIYQGNVIKSGYVNDASYGPFNIGFNFTYFGNTYSQFYVSSNGLVLFTDDPANIAFQETAIPNAAAPNNFIAAFWDDLVVDGTGKILYTTIGAAPNRKLIVQFNNMGFSSFPAYMGSFSVILYETSNVIKVQYRLIVDNTSPRPHGESASIGLENSDGTSGVQYLYHTVGDIYSGKAIEYTPSGLTYTSNPDAVYDGIFLTTNISLPEPSIPALLSPPQNAVIGSDYNFSWSDAGNAPSYSLLVSTSSDLAGATYYPAGMNTSFAVSGLALGATYYWGVFSSNATGITWCEIKKFSTSATPPLAAVPQTAWVEQNSEKIIKLQYTGGDGSATSAIVTSLPSQGALYQYNAGVKGALISVVPASVDDAGRNVIYVANGNTGNNAGNFNFKVHNSSGDSPDAQVTINVSPVGIPNLLYAAKNSIVELQFDQIMADPAGKQIQFSVTVNGTPATINTLSLKPNDPYSIIVSLSTPLAGTENVLISYTAGDIASAHGGLLASFSSLPVTLTAQIITFTQSLTRKFNESPLTLASTATSGLGLTYSSSNIAVATVTVNVLTFHSTGVSEITARQAGNATYAPARYIKPLTVEKGDQIITFNILPDKVIGDPDFSPGATASSGLLITYSSDNPNVATITGGMIHITGAGNALITATQPGDENYNAATGISQNLRVSLSTGLEDNVVSKNRFNIYPANYKINIQPLTDDWDGKIGSVHVFNIIGKAVSTLLSVEFRKNSLIYVDAPADRGIYFVELNSGIMRYVGKIIVR